MPRRSSWICISRNPARRRHWRAAKNFTKTIAAHAMALMVSANRPRRRRWPVPNGSTRKAFTGSRFDLPNRPARVFGNQRLGIVRGFFQSGQGGFIADISQRHADIAQKPAPFRPQHRRAGKTRFETGIVELQQLNQIRRGQILGARAASSNFLRAQNDSTDTRRDNRRSRRCDCRWPGAVRREWSLSVQSSDRKCSWRASSWNGAVMALVGQAVMQRVQLPQ